MVDAPLRKRSQLAIGYGDSEDDPIYFDFEEGESEHIGFFKVFISCSPANVQWISREESPLHQGERVQGVGENPTEPTYEGKWGVKVATIIQIKQEDGR
jgi:hypothetical protein